MFMPIHVLVDLFSVAKSIHKTATTFVFKDPTDELFHSLMDSSWSSRTTIGAYIVRCTVDTKTVVFRYHIGRSILYTNFEYNRDRFIARRWETIDQVQAIVTAKVLCEMGDWKHEFEVGEAWLLTSLRQEILFSLDPEMTNDFVMWIVKDDLAAKKINRRNEKKNDNFGHQGPCSTSFGSTGGLKDQDSSSLVNCTAMWTSSVATNRLGTQQLPILSQLDLHSAE